MRRLIAAGLKLADGRVTLAEAEAHYVRHVLRMRLGDQIELGDGAGTLARGALISVERAAVAVEVASVQQVPRPAGPEVTLIQAVAKGDKLDEIIRAGTELGVCRFVPVASERSVAQHEKRRDRWIGIATDAVRVSGRAWLPEVEAVTDLASVLARQWAGAKVVLALDGARAMGPEVPRSGPLAIIVGPEGGLTSEELESARGAGFVSVGLGRFTLRTQTAGPAAVAIAMFAGGGLDPA